MFNTFANDKLTATQKKVAVFLIIENVVEKQTINKNARYQKFHLYHDFFFKSSERYTLRARDKNSWAFVYVKGTSDEIDIMDQ